MLAQYRVPFNSHYTPDLYRRFLETLDARALTHVKFRNAETPCFFPRALLDKMARYGQEITAQLLSSKDYLAASDLEIPDQYRVPNESAQPLFLQADFGIDEELEPKLVEIQGFPSLYAYQPVLAETYRDVYNLPPELQFAFTPNYAALFREALLAGHDPAEVVLMEIDPLEQKTLPDFLLTEKLYGVKTVGVTDLVKRGNRLYHGDTPVRRIYNRVIFDELERKHIQPSFDFRDDLDVEWAGHPNWFYRISKYSLPYLYHDSVPRSWLMERIPGMPGDPENYVLKPLYSFAGLGVVVGPTREQIAAVIDRSDYIIQKRVNFVPVIETPFGPTKAEVRVMYIWLPDQSQPQPVTTIVRMGRGKMMGVDHNRDMEWVGATAGFFPV